VWCVCVCARVYDHRSEAACKALAWEEECTRISSSERETALRCDKLLRDLEFSAQDHAAANSAMEQVYRSLLTLIHIYRSLLTLRSRSRYLRHGTGERAQESCARHKVRRGCWQVKPGCKQRMQAAHNSQTQTHARTHTHTHTWQVKARMQATHDKEQAFIRDALRRSDRMREDDAAAWSRELQAINTKLNQDKAAWDCERGAMQRDLDEYADAVRRMQEVSLSLSLSRSLSNLNTQAELQAAVNLDYMCGWATSPHTSPQSVSGWCSKRY
jgi:hypothetical protein